MSLKFLHLADTHIGIENYGRLDPQTGLHTRLQDFIRCLRFAFEAAIEENVDLVLFAGDAYRACDPSPTHQRGFAAMVRLLRAEGIPLVMVTGNHDSPVAFGKASSLDIFDALGTQGIHVASSDRLFTLQTKSGPIQIACLPWLHRSRLLAKKPFLHLSQDEAVQQLQELGTAMIDEMASRLDPRLPAVLLAHLTAAEAAYSGSEQTAVIGRDPVFLTSTLANPAFDYVALGHIHKFQDLNPGARPPVVYSGSIERIDFGEESEAKGAVIVTIDQGPDRSERQAHYEFLRTPARPFKTIRVGVTDGSDPTRAILEEIGKHTLTGAIVRVIYDLSSGGTDLVDLKAIHKALDNAFLVAGIAPKPRAPSIRRRAAISEETGLKEALRAYVLNRPELAELETDLQEYALRLMAEWAEGGGE